MISADDFKVRFLDEWKQTPLVEAEGVYFKREDFNPTGSVKSRGLSYQVHNLLINGVKEAVISSSGNAALAAAYYASKAGIQMFVYVPHKIDPEKVELIRSYGAIIETSENPINKALHYSEEHKVPLIRQSADKIAPVGFEAIASELAIQMKELGLNLSEASIFFPVSSGTTVCGFYNGLKKLIIHEYPQIHIVQTQAVQTIAKEFDKGVRQKARTIVPGIVARKVENTYRDSVVGAIMQTGGSGWIVTDDDVIRANEWLDYAGITASLEGSLALTGYWKARSVFGLKKHIIVLLT